MPTSRLRQIACLLGLTVLSWLVMMGVHECGHVLGAWATGGVVQQVIWHPLVFSSTEVRPNPRPAVVVWAGPLLGMLLPGVVDAVASHLARRAVFATGFVSGFCLLANGAYLGVGWVDRVGDTAVMLQTGTPVWLLILVGVIATAAGLWRWHRISPSLGFGPTATVPAPRATALIALASIALLLASLVFGNPGA